jgi:hypothetical protein
MFTNVFEKHVAFILKLEAGEHGKNDSDTDRVDSVTLSKPIRV